MRSILYTKGINFVKYNIYQVMVPKIYFNCQKCLGKKKFLVLGVLLVCLLLLKFFYYSFFIQGVFIVIPPPPFLREGGGDAHTPHDTSEYMM